VSIDFIKQLILPVPNNQEMSDFSSRYSGVKELREGVPAITYSAFWRFG
jgi:hypothetical protein